MTAGLLAAGLACPAAALQQTPRSVPQPAPQPAQTQAEPDETLETTPSLVKMTTPVFIQGQGPFDFLIDTGANRSVLATELAAKLGLPLGPPARVHGIAGMQVKPTVNVADLRAGRLKFRLDGAPLLERADMDADGILGLDVFHGRRVTFDFVHQRVRVERGGSRSGTAGYGAGEFQTEVTVKARQRSGQLTIVDAAVAGAQIHCFIDSGADRSVGNMAMRRLVHSRGGDRGFEPIPVGIRGATGDFLLAQIAPTPALRIGGIRFDDFFMAYADVHTFSLWDLGDRPAMMMGMDLMRGFEAVSVDFGSRLVLFRLPPGVR